MIDARQEDGGLEDSVRGRNMARTAEDLKKGKKTELMETAGRRQVSNGQI